VMPYYLKLNVKYICNSGHSCARVLKNSTSNEYTTIVVGGKTISNVANGFANSVERLDDGASTWTSGPNLALGNIIWFSIEE
jgi:hypothetical protein